MRVRGVAVLVVVATLIGTACGNAKSKTDAATTTPGQTAPTQIDTSQLKVHNPITETGVTDKDIRVSVVASITNILGEDYKPFAQGIQAYFAMVNQQDGGIYGRQLKVVKVRDDHFSDNSNQVQAAISQDNPFAVFVATSLFAGAPKLAAANVPTFGWNINAEWAHHDMFFPNHAAVCFTCAGPMLPWIAQHDGITKVGLVAYGVPQSADCLTGNQNSFKKFGGNAKIVFQDKTLPFGVTDVSAQVANMKKAGVQMLLTCVDLNGAFTFAKEMKTQGLKAAIVLPNSYDQAFMRANGSYFEGSYVTAQFTPLEDTPQPPEIKTMIDWVTKQHATVKELTFQGWMAAQQMVTGLKLAGPNFNRAKLVGALNGMKDWTAHGMVAPIDWSVGHIPSNERPNNNSSGLDCWNWTKVVSGKFVPQFGQGDKPWVCFTNASIKPNDPAPIPIPSPTNYSFVGTGI